MHKHQIVAAADAANKTVPAETRVTMSQKQRKKIVPELEFVMENLNNDIEKSDIVLLGVSRTSKTPTSIYLANRGFKTSNIPILSNIDIDSTIRNISKTSKITKYGPLGCRIVKCLQARDLSTMVRHFYIFNGLNRYPFFLTLNLKFF